MNLNNLKLSKDIIKQNFHLSTQSLMHTGGIAKIAFFPTCEDEFIEILQEIKSQDLKFYIFGNAGNVLFPDKGLSSPVIFTVKMNKWHFCDETQNLLFKKSDEVILFAESGTSLTGLSFSMIKNSLSGMEFAYGIPASVGGAIFMNAGAYDSEIKNVARCVKYYDVKSGKIGFYTDDENKFSYRFSVFMKEPEKIILGAYFSLKKGINCEISEKSLGFMNARKSKQPLEYPSCGSAFKRSEGYFAGKLIEDAGLKGTNVGGAFISDKHAGFIVNKGGATTNDVLNLIEKVQNAIYGKFKVKLEPEIRIIKDE